ncbi:MAG: hypothetical protein KDJ87_09695, partial [Rhizobiaceae bacterium]|nr:hypothetical protein [Rhizobiaceae bacterium]
MDSGPVNAEPDSGCDVRGGRNHKIALKLGRVRHGIRNTIMIERTRLMAIKKRLLATAAIPFLAIAGASLPAAAAVMRPSVAIEAPSPIITVQSEEEVLPKKRKREAQREASDPSNAEGAEEPARKKRKERQQAESNQNDDAVSDEDIVNQGKKRKQRQQAEERMDQAQPSDSAESADQPARKKRKDAQQAESDR